jgi:hypothetical protein
MGPSSRHLGQSICWRAEAGDWWSNNLMNLYPPAIILANCHPTGNPNTKLLCNLIRVECCHPAGSAAVQGQSVC